MENNLKDLLIFIVDIDGTICDTSKRYAEINLMFPRIPGEKWGFKQQQEWIKPEGLKNAPLIPGSEKLGELIKRYEANLIFLTARSEQCRPITFWYLKHNLELPKSWQLLMRAPTNFDSDLICKEKMFLNWKKLNIPPLGESQKFVFLDDDLPMLGIWAKYGFAFKAPGCWGSNFKIGKVFENYQSNVKRS